MKSRVSFCIVLGLLASVLVSTGTSASLAADPNRFDELVQILEADEMDRKVDAVRSLGKIEDPRVVPLLVGMLERISDESIIKDERWWRTIEVTAVCLGRIGDRAALSGLKRTVESLERHHQDYRTWYAVRKGLATIDPVNHPFKSPAADVLIANRLNKDYDRAVRAQLKALGETTVVDLERVLWFDSPWDRFPRVLVAIDTLGEIGGGSAADVLRRYIRRQFDFEEGNERIFPIKALLALLKAAPCVATAEEVAKDARVLTDRERAFFVRSVSRMTSNELPIEAQRAIFQDTLLGPHSGKSRNSSGRAAAQALSRIGGPVAGRILSEVVSTSSHHYRAVAARALGEIEGYDPVPVLIEVSSQHDAPVGTIARALGRIGDPRAIPALRELATRDRLRDSDRWWIAAARARLGDDYEKNAALIRTELPRTIHHAAWLHDVETVGALAALIRPGQERQSRQVVDILLRIGTPEALHVLMTFPDVETDPARLRQIPPVVIDINAKLGRSDIDRQEVLTTLARGVRDSFGLPQWTKRFVPGQQRPCHLVREYPALARRIWMMEATWRLDAAEKAERWSHEYAIMSHSIESIARFWGPELVPVLERIVAESKFVTGSQGVRSYRSRSVAAGILTDKTGREYTFVDVDGQTHAGGWRPSVEP